jgi:predicted O-methyltransferase YrrM
MNDLSAGERLITNEAVDFYLYDITPARDPVLTEMERQAKDRDIPIVGPVVGRVLFQYAQAIGAKTVFELGSAIGYSTIWWARAVGEGGRVIYTDGDRKNAEEARRYFQQAGVLDRIEIRVGDALELLSEERAQCDVVVNDVDKEDYPRVLRLVPPRLRRGGLFITDNVLWRGQVAEEVKTDERASVIAEFNRQLYTSKDFFTTILPLRDGVSVATRT